MNIKKLIKPLLLIFVLLVLLSIYWHFFQKNRVSSFDALYCKTLDLDTCQESPICQEEFSGFCSGMMCTGALRYTGCRAYSRKEKLKIKMAEIKANCPGNSEFRVFNAHAKELKRVGGCSCGKVDGKQMNLDIGYLAGIGCLSVEELCSHFGGEWNVLAKKQECETEKGRFQHAVHLIESFSKQ